MTNDDRAKMKEILYIYVIPNNMEEITVEFYLVDIITHPHYIYYIVILCIKKSTLITVIQYIFK